MSDDVDSTGQEKCPICQRLNSPGADDTCEHFIGCIWDGDLIWGDFEAFQMAHSALREQWEAAEEKGHKAIQRLKALCAENSIDPGLLANEAPAATVLEDMGCFQSGDDIETDGMLSGSGHAIYHQDAKILARLTAQLKSVCDQTRGESPPANRPINDIQ